VPKTHELLQRARQQPDRQLPRAACDERLAWRAGGEPRLDGEHLCVAMLRCMHGMYGRAVFVVSYRSMRR
jgi:hypothetical protein